MEIRGAPPVVDERGASRIPYQLEIEGFWDDRPDGNLRIIVRLDAVTEERRKRLKIRDDFIIGY